MWGSNSRRSEERLGAIARLRVLVGYLGERGQFGWWPTDFYASSGAAFLVPAFARTLSLAQYHGVKEAARRVHDDHIGVGRVFHLFRLPETLEQSLYEALQDPATAQAAQGQVASSQTAALDALKSYFQTGAPTQEGPIQIGSIVDLKSDAWLAAAARCYHAAFANGLRSYPYLVDRA